MSAALAVSPDDLLDYGRALIVQAEDRAADLRTLAAARSADLALADKLFAELIDTPDLEPCHDAIGSTGAWLAATRRREDEEREGAAAAQRERARAWHRRWVSSRIPIEDVDPILVIRIVRGEANWDRGSYAERVLATDYLRNVSRYGIRRIASEFGLHRRAVERMARHARILRESAA